MNNYKLIIQYDGKAYSGWQIQHNAVTVQGTICDAIKTITRESVNLIGSGRTDAGVHALGQTANFRINRELDLYNFKFSLNSVLPKDISVLDIQKTTENFHARFDAVSRAYLYQVVSFKSPFYDPYSYFYHEKINCGYLNTLSKTLLGEHDFTSFSRKETELNSSVCRIREIRWRESKGLLIFYIEADRFLHGMVRTVAGTLLNSQKRLYDGKYLIDVLNARDRKSAGEALPAKGLFLYKVRY